MWYDALRKNRREERAMWMKKRVSEKAKKIVVKLAKRTASMEANTACVYFNYQPKETESVKQLRKF